MRSAIQAHGGPLAARTRSALLRQVTEAKQAARADTALRRIASLGTKIEGMPDEVEPKEARASGEGASYEALAKLERELRQLIEERLAGRDPGWWASRVPAEARNRAERRHANNETQYRWMRGQKASVVHYLDFPDYAAIICDDGNWNDAFGLVFGDRDLIGAKLRELGPIRRDVAHSRRLTPKQRAKLSLYADDITELIRRGT